MGLLAVDGVVGVERVVWRATANLFDDIQTSQPLREALVRVAERTTSTTVERTPRGILLHHVGTVDDTTFTEVLTLDPSSFELRSATNDQRTRNTSGKQTHFLVIKRTLTPIQVVKGQPKP